MLQSNMMASLNRFINHDADTSEAKGLEMPPEKKDDECTSTLIRDDSMPKRSHYGIPGVNTTLQEILKEQTNDRFPD